MNLTRLSIVALFTLMSLTSTSAQAAPPAGSSDTPQKMVFAHYMVACPTAGGHATVEDYKQEIREAQSRGIDGFALNCGGWTAKNSYYKARTLMIYEAAKELGTHFQLFLSADFCCGMTLAEVQDMVDTFRDHPNQFRYHGKPVLSTYGGQGVHEGGITLPAFLDQKYGTGSARSLVFVPNLHPQPYTEQFHQKDAQQLLAQYPTIDGLFYFGGAGTGTEIAQSNAVGAQSLTGSGRIYMASVTPFYRAGGGNYRIFETLGLQAMQQEWESAIQNNATWVEIVTWNDWYESSYVAPFGSPSQTDLWHGHYGPKMLSHTAYLDASRYYIDWFKTGKQPAITHDKLFYFYRLHPKTLPALVKVEDPNSKTALPSHAETLQDNVFATLFLTAPAQLSITSGIQTQTFSLAAGVQNVTMPFDTGPQRFVLRRGGQIVLDKTGEHEISATDPSSRFNYFAGEAP